MIGAIFRSRTAALVPGAIRAPGSRILWRILSGLSAALAVTIAVAAGAAAEPFVPASDDVVLERLPTLAAADRGEFDQLKTVLAKDPTNPDAALRLAARYVERGRTEGDPRYDGYAEAALAPWWSQPDAPSGVLLIRATLAQRRHDFATALTDLDKVLDVQPRHPQAWLLRASILRTQARYDDALESCQRLFRLAPAAVLTTCAVDITSLQGQANRAYDQLASIADRSPDQPSGVHAWARLVLAEIAERLGRTEQAETLYRRMLAEGGRDVVTLSAYADLLLDQQRYDEVRALLGAETRVDGLLLRLALAEKALGGEQSPRLIAMLQDRFEAARRRGDTVHLREEARFRLHLDADPGAALRLATLNWQQQREPWDARLLLEAALAARQPEAAQPVLDWLTHNSVEGVQLRQLAARIEQART